MCVCATAGRGGEVEHRTLERSVEPAGERVAAEQFAPAMMDEEVRSMCRRLHGRQRFGVGIEHTRGFECHAGRARPRRRRCDHQLATRAVHSEHEPEQVWHPMGHARRQLHRHLSRGVIAVQFYLEGAQRAPAGGYRGPSHAAGGAERFPRRAVERKWGSESQRARQRREIAKRAGAGEELGGLVE